MAERLATRTYLDGSAPGRAWANADLRRDRSAEQRSAARRSRDGAAAPAGGATQHDGGSQPDAPAALAQAPAAGLGRRPAQPSSRLGGALLLGGDRSRR